MKQIIAQLHDHGAKIYGATFTPYEGAVFLIAGITRHPEGIRSDREMFQPFANR